MGKEGPEEGGKCYGEEGDENHVAAQDVHGVVDPVHRGSETDDDVISGDSNIELVSTYRLAKAASLEACLPHLRRNFARLFERLRTCEFSTLTGEEANLSAGIIFALHSKLLQLLRLAYISLTGQQACLAGERLRKLLAERVGDDALERKIEDSGADGQHQHEG